jgi:IS605 OrfB family transposase
MKTVVRKTLIKTITTKHQQDYLDGLVDDIIHRAVTILKVLLSYKHKFVDIRGVDGQIKSVKFTDVFDEELVSLYDMIVKTSNSSRCIRGSFVLTACKTGLNSDKPLEQQLRKLIDRGDLPIKIGNWEHGTGYDFAAFQVAISALKSWDDRNNITIKQYQSQVKLVEETQPEDTYVFALDTWLIKHKLTLTKRVANKFKKFGWTTRINGWPWGELSSIDSDETKWSVVMDWKVKQQRLNVLRPTAAFTMPESGVSEREIPFGKNYQKFSLDFRNGKFIINIDDHNIETLPTKYFRNLKVISVSDKNIEYCFTYERGNNSSFDERVVANLKEITLVRKNGEYYFGVPLNVSIPNIDEETQSIIDSYFSGDVVNDWPSDVGIMGVDLGITNPASCTVTKTIAEGKYKKINSFVIGKVKNQQYFDKLDRFGKKLRDIHKILDGLDDEVKDLEPFSKLWLTACEECATKIKKIRKEMNQLRRSDLNIRNRGVSAEQIKFILLYKKYIRLLQRWTDFGTKPTEEKNNKFKKHYIRLAKLKLDFRKKVACEIIRMAREYDVSIIVVEDLQHFRPDTTERAESNERLMLWGHGEINRWLKHFADQYGIFVITVNPKYTSQIDAQTGYFGYRDDYDRSKLYVERNGKLEAIHADINASENIVSKIHYLDANASFLLATKLEEDYILRIDKDEEKKTAKRRKRALTSQFGSHKIKVTEDGRVVALKITPKPGGKEVYLYRYRDGWWPRSIHEERKKALAARAKAMNKTQGGSRISEVHDV